MEGGGGKQDPLVLVFLIIEEEFSTILSVPNNYPLLAYHDDLLRFHQPVQSTCRSADLLAQLASSK